MRRVLNSFLFLVSGLIVNADVQTADFLNQYCVRCHGQNKQKADRRFDTLPAQIKKLSDLERYQEIVDQYAWKQIQETKTNLKNDVFPYIL